MHPHRVRELSRHESRVDLIRGWNKHSVSSTEFDNIIYAVQCTQEQIIDVARCSKCENPENHGYIQRLILFIPLFYISPLRAGNAIFVIEQTLFL